MAEDKKKKKIVWFPFLIETGAGAVLWNSITWIWGKLFKKKEDSK